MIASKELSTKIAINGFLGKMGQSIFNESKNSSLYDVRVGCDIAQKINDLKLDPEIWHEKSGGVILTSDLNECKELYDVVIDFSLPESSERIVKLCCDLNKPITIGTTGFTNDQLKKIETAAESIPILLAPNMSYGVNVCFHTLSILAKKLKNYEVSITETHHKNKIDSPSGTAIKMAEIICESKNIKLGNIKSSDCPIKIESHRVDSEVGIHEVIFKNELNELKLTHKAYSRSIFAKGALDTSLWLVSQSPGLYHFNDFMDASHE